MVQRAVTMIRLQRMSILCLNEMNKINNEDEKIKMSMGMKTKYDEQYLINNTYPPNLR